MTDGGGSGHAIVVGAGPAGLAVARGLARSHWTVEVWDPRTPTQRSMERRLIQLWGNGLSALDTLGLTRCVEEVAERGVRGRPTRLHRLDLHDWSGHRLWTLPLGDRTSRLVELGKLVGALEAEVSGPDVTVATRRFWRFTDGPRQLTVLDAEGEATRCDLLVGADGGRSAVAQQMLGPLPGRPVGVAVACGYTPRGAIEVSPWKRLLDSTGALGPGKAYSAQGCGANSWAVALRDDVYWMIFSRQDGRLTEESLVAELAIAPPGLQFLVRAARDADGIVGVQRVFDRRPLKCWSVGRVGLAGNAAHPITPDTGQGTNLGFEDACALATHVSTHGATNGLARYGRERALRVAAAVEQSRLLSRATTVPWPWLAAVRDGLSARLGPRAAHASLDFLVNHRPSELRSE